MWVGKIFPHIDVGGEIFPNKDVGGFAGADFAPNLRRGTRPISTWKTREKKITSCFTSKGVQEKADREHLYFASKRESMTANCHL